MFLKKTSPLVKGRTYPNKASLVPLNIKADMTSMGLKLRSRDKTLCWLPQGARRRVQKNGCQEEREKGKMSLSVN